MLGDVFYFYVTRLIKIVFYFERTPFPNHGPYYDTGFRLRFNESYPNNKTNDFLFLNINTEMELARQYSIVEYSIVYFTFVFVQNKIFYF